MPAKESDSEDRAGCGALSIEIAWSLDYCLEKG
jgi:hypothetical protein